MTSQYGEAKVRGEHRFQLQIESDWTTDFKPGNVKKLNNNQIWTTTTSVSISLGYSFTEVLPTILLKGVMSYHAVTCWHLLDLDMFLSN